MASTSTCAHRAYYITPLITLNYASWSVKIEMLLIQSELWTVIDGTEATPASSHVTSLATWKLKDSKAHSNILLYCG